MDAIIQRAQKLQGTLTVPPDKAIGHRVTLLAAIANGVTEISPWPSGDDCQRTLQLVEGLGVRVQRGAGRISVTGRPEGLCAPSEVLDCGESGTTLRIAAGLLAGQPFTTRLSAGPSLSGRPMRRIVEPLSQMGARVDGVAGPAASAECYPPLTIYGTRPLRPIRYAMPVASAQVKSAVLLAGLFADGATTVIEPSPTRDHTERALRWFGGRVETGGRGLSVTPGPLTSPGRVVLPGDCSSAAFLIVAACCVPGSKLELRGVGLNPTRTGALRILQRMGAAIRVSVTDEAWEPRGTVVVEARPLQALVLEPHEVPGVIDELPILMVAAACARGTSSFRGLGELRVKETDRLRSMVQGLQALGVLVHEPATDIVEILGGPLRAGTASSAGDHRTAMSLAVGALLADGGGSAVRGAECVSKSYPEFFADLASLAGSSTVKTVDKA